MARRMADPHQADEITQDLKRDVPVWGYFQYLLIPLGVIFINFALAFLGVVGVRVVRRLQAERGETRRRSRAEQPSPTLLIGAVVPVELAPALVIEQVADHAHHPRSVQNVE